MRVTVIAAAALISIALGAIAWSLRVPPWQAVESGNGSFVLNRRTGELYQAENGTLRRVVREGPGAHFARTLSPPLSFDEWIVDEGLYASFRVKHRGETVYVMGSLRPYVDLTALDRRLLHLLTLVLLDRDGFEVAKLNLGHTNLVTAIDEEGKPYAAAVAANQLLPATDYDEVARVQISWIQPVEDMVATWKATKAGTEAIERLREELEKEAGRGVRDAGQQVPLGVRPAPAEPSSGLGVPLGARGAQ